MMNSRLLTEHVSFEQRAESWQDAIRMAARPLVEANKVEERYVDAMIANVETLGPYIVIMPGVAMPHSRTEDGAKETCVSVMKLSEEVEFPGENKVKLVVVLAAKENNKHMEPLSDMCDVFMDDDLMDRLMQADSLEKVRACLA